MKKRNKRGHGAVPAKKGSMPAPSGGIVAGGSPMAAGAGPGAPTPGPNEFSAPQEQAMRQGAAASRMPPDMDLDGM